MSGLKIRPLPLNNPVNAAAAASLPEDNAAAAAKGTEEVLGETWEGPEFRPLIDALDAIGVDDIDALLGRHGLARVAGAMLHMTLKDRSTIKNPSGFLYSLLSGKLDYSWTIGRYRPHVSWGLVVQGLYYWSPPKSGVPAV